MLSFSTFPGSGSFDESRYAQAVASLPEERMRAAAAVIARQRPATANGVCFILLEDEHGTVNLIVPPDLYRRERLIVRTEPMMVAEGVFERHPEAGGGVNVLCKRLTTFSGSDFRAVAPPVQSFAQGRR